MKLTAALGGLLAVLSLSTPALADFTDLNGYRVFDAQRRVTNTQMQNMQAAHEQVVLQRSVLQNASNYNNVIIVNQNGNDNYLNIDSNMTSSGGQTAGNKNNQR